MLDIIDKLVERIFDLYVYIRYRRFKRIIAGFIGSSLLLISIIGVLVLGNLSSGLIAGIATIPTIILLLYALRGTMLIYRFHDLLNRLHNDIEGSKDKRQIEKYGKEMIRNYNTDWFGPHTALNGTDIKFEWFTDTPEMKSGRNDIICLKESSEETTNKARIALHYAENAVLNNFRYYISDKLGGGILYFLSIDIAEKSGAEGVVTLLKQDLVPHKVDSRGTSIKDSLEIFEKITTIREGGFFSSVFIGECSKLTDTPAHKLKYSREDADNLLEKLVDMQHILEEDVIEEAHFRGNSMDCKILLIHRWTNVVRMKERIKKLIGEEDYEAIYVLAIGRAIHVAEKVTMTAHAEVPGVHDIDSDTYLLETDEGRKNRYYAQLHTIRED